MEEFEWNYFPVREIIPKSGMYAIGAKIELDKSITYLTCNEFADVDSIRVKSITAKDEPLTPEQHCAIRSASPVSNLPEERITRRLF